MLFRFEVIIMCFGIAIDPYISRLTIFTPWQILLAIRQLKGPHTRENQAEIIIEVIKEYELGARIGYFVINNALNNDIAVDAILKHFFPAMTPK